MNVAQVYTKQLCTPLRYPGGKTSLYRFFDAVIQDNGLECVTYIEPYAGGAGAGLALLIQDKVAKVVINDYDIAVYAFWKSILDSTDAFLVRLENVPLTIEEWKHQKEIYTRKDATNLLDLGFATFYLNRANRSGILRAGPVGGRTQSGKWRLDARFNKAKLIERIRAVAQRSHRISVLNMDGIEAIEKYANQPGSFFYVDPPYYVKGSQLYLNAFKITDHESLARTLNKNSSANWILTYDNVPEIRSLYPKRQQEDYTLGYSAHNKTRKGSEIMIFSDSLRIPQL